MRVFALISVPTLNTAPIFSNLENRQVEKGPKMRLTHSQIADVRQQQTQRIDPRQILASEILTWTSEELEAAIARETGENPALEIRDTGEGYVRPVDRVVPPTTPTPMRDEPLRLVGEDDWDDPLERVAGACTLRDHLRDQVGQVAQKADVPVVRYLIECLDDRGYLAADNDEIAERFGITAFEVNRAISALQRMEPPGVGAHDLRECLLLQVDFLEQAGDAHPLARALVVRFWEDLVSHRVERIASRLREPVASVREAIVFLQRSLTPYPGAAFRPSHGGRSGSGAATVRPDVVFHRGAAGFDIELTRDFETLLCIAPLWQRFAEQPEAADGAMRRYIREHVERAQAFLTGVSRRGQTLRRLAAALTEMQQGYLETGNRAFLRPLTRQFLAEYLELDESVISRAVADKWVQLPSGEVVPLDAFFGNAHAVRDALVQLIAGEDPAEPYSDDEIADLLGEQGFSLARRTVAKYRAQEKILPARLRRRTTVPEPLIERREKRQAA